MNLAFSTNAYLKFSFPETVRRLAKIGYAGVEIMADVPHAWPAFMLDEQKQAMRDEPAETIPRVAKYIRHFHLEDIAATRVHHHLVPGEGAIEFGPVLRAIRALDYNGWVTIELYPYVDDPDLAARTALARVQDCLV